MNEFGNQITFEEYNDTDEWIITIQLKGLDENIKNAKYIAFFYYSESGVDEDKDDEDPKPFLFSN